mgnify:CR=1 FL=1
MKTTTHVNRFGHSVTTVYGFACGYKQGIDTGDMNKEIYKDFKNGMSYVELVAKYRRDSAVLHRIIERYQKKEK